MTKRLSLLTLVLLFAIACPSLADKIIYVDADAAGANDGTSWASAYNYLQDGLADANSAVKPVEVRVAQGVYKPDRSAAEPDGTGDREATFQLVKGVAIKGGYAGFGEPDPNVRDIELYETILSGDLDGDDVQVPPSDLLTEPSRGENSYHVLTGSGTNATAVLDGFIITAGNATDKPFPHDNGGGIFNHYGRPMLLNCVFIGNAAISGGAVYNSDTGETGYGHDPTIIINCLFSGNLARSGGAVSNCWAKAKVINCTFNCNTAERYGGGISIGQGSSLIVTNSVFWGNIDKDGTGETSQITAWYKDINYSCIQGWTGSFGGAGNIGSNPLLLDADGADNVLGTLDDNPRLLQGSACIDAGDNSAVPPSVLTDLDGGARIANGTVDMGAYEGAHQGFLLNTEQVTIPEGSTATFTVALVTDPLGTVEAEVTRYSGDLDITVETGTSLTFNSSNYSEAQTVTLAAAEDTDSFDGTAQIRVNAEGFAAAGVSASEEDNEPVPEVLFVDDSAPGTSEADEGASWSKAFTDLQEALRIATTNSEVAEIRVAQGIYTPAEPDGYREIAFQLINGVAIKGGYAGFGEPDPDARDIELYVTILSGDLNGDDVDVSNPVDLISEPTRAENSYNVVSGSGTDGTAALDGFTITAGNANGLSPWNQNNRGGGINGGSAALANCTISWNSAGEHGGGLYNCAGPITNCTITYNRAEDRGGGLTGCSGPITNCTISGNACEDWGGGLYGCAGPITNCTISINSARLKGGGLCSSGNAGINNCVISGNSAGIGGGLYDKTRLRPAAEFIAKRAPQD